MAGEQDSVYSNRNLIFVAVTAALLSAYSAYKVSQQPTAAPSLPPFCAGCGTECKPGECKRLEYKYVYLPADRKPFTVQCPWCNRFCVVTPPETGSAAAKVVGKAVAGAAK